MYCHTLLYILIAKPHIQRRGRCVSPPMPREGLPESGRVAAAFRTEIPHAHGFDSIGIFCARGDIFKQRGDSPGHSDPKDLSSRGLV